MTTRMLALTALMAIGFQARTGLIEVVLRDATNNLPLQGVQIHLRALNGAPPSDLPVTFTDGNGRAAFRELDFGNYSLKIEHPGYVVASGLPQYLIIEAETQRGPLEIFLKPTATVSGRILTASGDPFPGAQVWAVSLSYFAGRRGLGLPVGGTGVTSRTETNADGEFQLSGLWPGEYYLRIDQSGPLSKDSTRDQFPRVSYYPGVVDPAAAVSLTLRGQNVVGLEIRVPSVRAFKISGTVVNFKPAVVSNTGSFQGFYIVSAEPNTIEEPYPVSSRATPGSNPNETNFEIGGITPGSYYLFPVGGPSAASLDYATNRTLVTVDDHDVTGLRIILNPNLEIKGRFLVNGDASGIDWDIIIVKATPKDRLPSLLAGIGATPGSGSPHPESGEFTLKGLTANERFSLAVSGLPNNAYVSDLRQGSNTTLYEGAIRANPAYGPVEVVIDMRGGRVQGTVRSSSDQPAGGAVVVLIPPVVYRRNSMFYRRVVADSEGRFSMVGIAPGDYKLMAWTTLPFGQPEENEQFIATYEPRATAVTVRANALSEVRLSVIPTP